MKTFPASKMLMHAFAIVVAIATTASPAVAGLRTYVSTNGSNAVGCGVVTSPCQTLQYAHGVTSAGGEIIILDSGVYGAVSIKKAISIVNDGAGTATISAGANGNAITITTPNATDVVHLRGLEIDGLGGGANGIVFKGQGKLDVVRCIVRRFTGTNADGKGVGILFFANSVSPSTFSIDDTIVSDNAGVGIYSVSLSGDPAKQEAIGYINNSTIRNNAYGVDVNAFSNFNAVTITDSLINENMNYDLFIMGVVGATNAHATVIRTKILPRGLYSVYITSGRARFIDSMAIGIKCGATADVYTDGTNNLDTDFFGCGKISVPRN